MPTFPGNKRLSCLSIAAIKALLETFEPDDSVIAALDADPRAGVKALARILENRRRRAGSLRRKQEEMLAIERSLRASGKTLIAGVDEAGRGPLAGPVVAAAVILPEEVELYGLDDSKKLSAKQREELFGPICSQAIAWGIGMAGNDEIDETGILEATMRAMRLAVENLKVTPDIVIVDGNRLPGLACDERAVVDGDALSLSIAAASVIAKVTRDRMMVEMDGMFPGYGFARHKGYGSREHVEALRRLGPCIIHRFSFDIVPDVSPPGTTLSVLRQRLLTAPCRKTLERAAAGIARVRESLSEADLAELRNAYRRRRAVLRENRKKTGLMGETLSCEYLARKGYTILTRNWRASECNYEIDIVARIGRILVFCEVKTAGTEQFGPSVSWVTPEKTVHIARAAQEYIATHELGEHEYRFDVIGLRKRGETFDIVHIENAFSAPESL